MEPASKFVDPERPMPQARWNNSVIASSTDTVVVEGNHYFPKEDVDETVLRASDHRTTCPWKGVAYYYDIVVGSETNRNAAWSYPEPKSEAAHIKGRVAFWKGVKVTQGE